MLWFGRFGSIFNFLQIYHFLRWWHPVLVQCVCWLLGPRSYPSSCFVGWPSHFQPNKFTCFALKRLWTSKAVIYGCTNLVNRDERGRGIVSHILMTQSCFCLIILAQDIRFFVSGLVVVVVVVEMRGLNGGYVGRKWFCLGWIIFQLLRLFYQRFWLKVRGFEVLGFRKDVLAFHSKNFGLIMTIV